MYTHSFNRFDRILLTCIGLFALATIFSCKKEESGTPPLSTSNDPIMSVFIGSQEWMTKNLSVATYSDGTPIPQRSNNNDWWYYPTGAWCWYNNDSATYAATYGRLYNWYAVAGIYDEASKLDPSLRKQLAPIGWHVPSDAEWSVMINFLDSTADGGNAYPNGVGILMKTTGTIEDGTGLWHEPIWDLSSVGNNSSGFSGTPGGYRSAYPGTYYSNGFQGQWWSSSEEGPSTAWIRSLDYGDSNVYRGSLENRHGLSVRCIRD